jgi:hypothetical protein
MLAREGRAVNERTHLRWYVLGLGRESPRGTERAQRNARLPKYWRYGGQVGRDEHDFEDFPLHPACPPQG